MELYRQNNIALYIENVILRKMLISARQNPLLESGGVVLGRKELDWEKYVITDIGIPTRYDTQSAFSFVRNRENAQRVVNHAWEQSNGEVNHIGEWHSHIFPSPFPSWQDRQDMKRAYYDHECLFEHFFTLIVSSDLKVYVGVVKKGVIIEYSIVKVGKECTDIVRDISRKP